MAKRKYSDEERIQRQRESAKRRYWANIEESRKQNREKKKALYDKTPEKFRAQARALYWKDVERNREKNRQQAKKHNHKRALKNRARRWEKRIAIIQKLGGKCAECGFDNPLALTFHHLNGKDWRYDWINNNFDVSELKLLCHNCHNILHITEKMKYNP